MKKNVFVAGHKGMVGSAIVRLLRTFDNINLVLVDRHEMDLTNQAAVTNFFSATKIDEIYMAAAKVGGIHANNEYPADFIYQNMAIQTNVIQAAHSSGVDKILFLGSSCIYPKNTDQPITEEKLLTGVLESTNEPYAIAKIAGIKLCESFNRQYGRDYRSVMPTNLYGQNDNFHPDNSHVIPALIRRFHEAKTQKSAKVVAWGSGSPRREFLHVDDLASACLHVMSLEKDLYTRYTSPMLSHVNVGSGRDCTIRELVETIAEVVQYPGEIVFDETKPDGTPRKLMCSSKLNALGWRYQIELIDGLKKTYEWFLLNQSMFRSS